MSYSIFRANGCRAPYSYHTAPPSHLLFVYYCRHVPTGKVTREQAYFEGREAFDACLTRWNNDAPGFWRYSEEEPQ